MGKRPKKNIVLVLLEGISDREALRIGISELFERIDKNIEVFFPIIRIGSEEQGGDITTRRYSNERNQKKWVCPDNIENAIYLLFLKDFFDEKKLMPKDITEIIQIIDLDGAYIQDDCILFDKDLSENDATIYKDSNIICRDVENIIKRNKQKRNNIDFLITKTCIKVKSKSTPYSIYYFSSNIDHFLHNDANLDKSRKVIEARNFSTLYIGDTDRFVQKFSNDPDATIGMTYEESWEFIKKDNHSLHRHTNINILLKKLDRLIKAQA